MKVHDSSICRHSDLLQTKCTVQWIFTIGTSYITCQYNTTNTKYSYSTVPVWTYCFCHFFATCTYITLLILVVELFFSLQLGCCIVSRRRCLSGRRCCSCRSSLIAKSKTMEFKLLSKGLVYAYGTTTASVKLNCVIQK